MDNLTSSMSKLLIDKPIDYAASKLAEAMQNMNLSTIKCKYCDWDAVKAVFFFESNGDNSYDLKEEAMLCDECINETKEGLVTNYSVYNKSTGTRRDGLAVLID